MADFVAMSKNEEADELAVLVAEMQSFTQTLKAAANAVLVNSDALDSIQRIELWLLWGDLQPHAAEFTVGVEKVLGDA